eukprot:GHVL01023610.1.p1 GENE.GHVL01023610.1~~GHVL01023610.1.p1  ORF type:complete len:327 (+),score=64.03 GHVL01023610.1:653-1633(+)
MKRPTPRPLGGAIASSVTSAAVASDSDMMMCQLPDSSIVGADLDVDGHPTRRSRRIKERNIAESFSRLVQASGRGDGSREGVFLGDCSPKNGAIVSSSLHRSNRAVRLFGTPGSFITGQIAEEASSSDFDDSDEVDMESCRDQDRLGHSDRSPGTPMTLSTVAGSSPHTRDSSSSSPGHSVPEDPVTVKGTFMGMSVRKLDFFCREWMGGQTNGSAFDKSSQRDESRTGSTDDCFGRRCGNANGTGPPQQSPDSQQNVPLRAPSPSLVPQAADLDKQAVEQLNDLAFREFDQMGVKDTLAAFDDRVSLDLSPPQKWLSPPSSPIIS